MIGWFNSEIEKKCRHFYRVLPRTVVTLLSGEREGEGGSGCGR